MSDSNSKEEQQQKKLKDYENALKLGEVMVAYTRVMTIGPGGIGKSSLLRGLMNQRLLHNAESTILADTKRVKPQFWAKARDSNEGYWAEVTDKDEIQELAGLLQLVALAHSTPSHAATIIPKMANDVTVKFKTKKIQTINDEYVCSIKNKAVQIVLKQALEHTQSLPATPKSEVLIHVWDCGGQPAFLDVLPAFLTSRTMFLLSFDARQNLLDKCNSLSYKNGRVVSNSEQNFTLLQLLTQWMASIHSMCTQKTTSVNAIPEAFSTPSQNETTTESKKNASDPLDSNSWQQNSTISHQNIGGEDIPKFPRIIPVGTHGDDPQVKQKKTEILSTLLSHCENKGYIHLLMNGVIVDITTAGCGREAEDKQFMYIREKVYQLASKHLRVRTPVSWVLFRKVLQMVAKGNPIVSYDQAVNVGEACWIAADVVPSVLHFYHELAVFLHYANIKSLSQYIVVDPQWLITQLGKLLAPEGLEQKISNCSLWKPLRGNGILVQPLYEEVWEECFLNPQSLADLLEHFLLAAPIDPPLSVCRIPGRKYFVPSVLQLTTQDTDSSPKSREVVKRSSPLYLTFSTDYVPPGFFTRLATSLTRKPKCQPLFERGVFRNKMTFVYGEVGKRIDEFTILEQSTSVQITVVRTKHRHSHKIMTFGNTCCDILRTLQACLPTVFQWVPSVKVEAAFFCEQCPGKNHFITIPPDTETDSDLLCEADQSCSLTREMQYWLKIPLTPQHLAQKGDFSNSELKRVACDVQECGKLKELADELEMADQLKSLEHDADAPITLLRRWHSEIECELKAHSLLVHHLKSIGLTKTSERLQYRDFLSSSEPPSKTNLLRHHSRYNLEETSLSNELSVEYSTDLLAPPPPKRARESLQFTGAPLLRDLLNNVKTTMWYELGLELDISSDDLDIIQHDLSEIKERLRRMFQKWLNVCVSPSWSLIINALKNIGEGALANRLEQQF